jgi:hypothetical protein
MVMGRIGNVTWKGKNYWITGVPVEVCERCGEKYYGGPVLLQIEEMLKTQNGDREDLTLHFKAA